MADRTVHTRWTGGMRAVTRAGGFDIAVDEPQTAGGTDTAPQPTDLLLASISSCFALAMAHVAKRRGIELVRLVVTATGSYAGPRFARIAVSVTADTPRAVLQELLPEAGRVCYVSNTLRRPLDLVVELG